MSAGPAQVAVLGRPGYRPTPRAREAGGTGTPLLRLSAFAALGLYGVLRWSSMFSRGGTVRLLGLLVLALVLVCLRAPLARRSRLLAALFTALVLVVALTLAGIPLAWLWHLRIAVTARAIGDGLSALPQISLPYDGSDQWVRLDITLGAAILLFDAALLLAFAPRPIEGLRCAGVALPLLALAAVPLTAVHSRLVYVDGAILFGLLAVFVWADRVRNRQAGGAFLLCGLATIVAMVAAPALDRHHGWINYNALAGNLAPQALDSFDWTQTYGPIDWPRRGRIVLEIGARHPEYWKTEDLDVFDGRAWTQGIVPGDQNTPSPTPAARAQWTQTIHVALRDMRSADVVGAGVSGRPDGLSRAVLSGFSAGTWTATTDLQPGDSYTISVYTPNPTSAELTAAGTAYAGLPPGYRTILLPLSPASATGAAPQIVFPPFHSRQPVENVVGLPVGAGAAVLDSSPYAGAYRIARRLAARAATPYAFVLAVERFLSHYVYSETPPVRQYPLASFLLADRRGYCQQFAGAMALLLRMGGVPARVSVGFTQGRQGSVTNHWLVTDSDAHAWVEAWFPSYGWVRFDPTPPADPALSGPAAAPYVSSTTSYKSSLQVAHGHASRPAFHTHPRAGAPRASSSGNSAVLAASFGVAGLVLLGLVLFATRPLGSADALVTELERALGRSGRPPGRGATLATIERGMSSEAAEYVRALRLARFAGHDDFPTTRQRRALRRQLALRRGPWSALRALWALPPRRHPRPGQHADPPPTRAGGPPGPRRVGSPPTHAASPRPSRAPGWPEA